MPLLPDEIKATLPDLYSQEREPDPMVYCKLLTRDGRFTWYLTEYSQDDGDTCFGWIVTDGEGEFGYFSLQYLQDRISELFLETWDAQGKRQVKIFGDRLAPVVRDDAFVPQRLSEVKRWY